MNSDAHLHNTRQLFLIGAPRSGTTILTRLLNAHPQVLLSNETAVFLQLSYMIDKSEKGSKSGILFGKEHHGLWANHLRLNAKHLIETFYTEVLVREQKSAVKYWGEKHPHLHTCLPFVSDLYPEAIYIYAIRDPRDVSCSMAEMNAVPILQASRNLRRFTLAYEAFVERIAPQRVHVVQYERLVADYEAVIGNLLKSLELDIDDNLLHYIQENKNKDSHHAEHSRPVEFAAKSVARHKREVSKEDQATLLAEHKDFMVKHGYIEDDALANARTQIASLMAATNERDQRLAALMQSSSWRVTAPLRSIKLRVAWLFRKSARAARLVGWICTGKFRQTAHALLPFYRRYAPRWVGSIIPHRMRRWLWASASSPSSAVLQSLKGPDSRDIPAQSEFTVKHGYIETGDIVSAPSQSIAFECNICGFQNKVDRAKLNRERRSCANCGSSVRTRSIVHLLSTEIFGESLRLSDFPTSRETSGVGLSCWDGYANLLACKFSYQNTYYHKEPWFDICNPDRVGALDFLISSEVFEHVESPVSRAFDGAYRALKAEGVLILTTPFRNEGTTIEHFPELFDWKLVQREGGATVLVNQTADGRSQEFSNLRFHGGPGQNLEMRVFSREDLLSQLARAGFSRVSVRGEDYPRFGVFWQHPWSVPIVARK